MCVEKYNTSTIQKKLFCCDIAIKNLAIASFLTSTFLYRIYDPVYKSKVEVKISCTKMYKSYQIIHQQIKLLISIFNATRVKQKCAQNAKVSQNFTILMVLDSKT